MKNRNVHIRSNVLLVAFVIGMAVVGRAEKPETPEGPAAPPPILGLPGYPFNPLAERGKYRCLTTRQIPLTEDQKVGRRNHIVFDLCVATAFTPLGTKIVRKAFDRAVEKALKPDVFQCAKAATREEVGEWRKFLAKYVVGVVGGVVGRATVKPAVYISALEEASDRDRFAEGYTNYFEGGTSIFGLIAPSNLIQPHLSIAVRGDLIGSHSVPYGEDVDFWAVMLSGAWMKNVGFAESLSNPSGTFLYEWMNCFFPRGDQP